MNLCLSVKEIYLTFVIGIFYTGAHNLWFATIQLPTFNWRNIESYATYQENLKYASFGLENVFGSIQLITLKSNI